MVDQPKTQPASLGDSFTELRIRLDKTQKGGEAIGNKHCNLTCLACHDDNFYYPDLDIKSINNRQFVESVARLIDITGIESAIIYLAGRGEPTYLGEKELCDLIVPLKKLSNVTRVKMTTNGILLGKMVKTLKRAGLDAVNISINSLNKERYNFYTGADGLPFVLNSLEAASNEDINITVNVIYSKLNYDEIEDYILLSQKFKGIVIKFFDVLPLNLIGERMFLPMNYLHKTLEDLSDNIRHDDGFYTTRSYTFPKGGKIIVKGSSENNCMNLYCAVRSQCNEDCRNIVRIGLDGFLRPCGIRSDNTIDLTSKDISDQQVLECLASGGKHFETDRMVL